MRPTEAVVDLSAIASNVETLRRIVGPSVELCAVVKANGYGHGAVEVASVAVDAGVARLAVAMVLEAAMLRRAGITAPIIVLSEPPPEDMAAAADLGLEVTAYSVPGVAAASAAGVAVHLKVDTGMHRVGCDPGDAPSLASQITTGRSRFAGLYTHLAVADAPDDPFTDVQLDRFESVVDAVRAVAAPEQLHAANSAGTFAHPRARYDMVRCGISLYGIPPAPGIGDAELHPALTLRSAVSALRRIGSGETVSYGRRWTAERSTTVATVPIGYADGVARRLGLVGGEVLIGGRLRPIRGVVTMDQLVVDCGDHPVAVGDEVVLIGAQGGECITANEVASRLDTVGYEIVCAIGPRVPRRYAR